MAGAYRVGQGRTMKRVLRRAVVPGLALVVFAAAVLVVDQASAQEANVYRQFLGMDSRRLVWMLAQMHLFFGAFVLGVPLFAVTIEIVGWRNKDPKYDALAYEFTGLLSVAYATTAALGGLLAFSLFTLYPTFMGYMAGAFKDIMFMYALLFFAETFLLYLYYYGWKWMKGGEPFKPTPAADHLRALAIDRHHGRWRAFAFGLVGPKMRVDTKARS